MIDRAISEYLSKNFVRKSNLYSKQSWKNGDIFLTERNKLYRTQILYPRISKKKRRLKYKQILKKIILHFFAANICNFFIFYWLNQRFSTWGTLEAHL